MEKDSMKVELMFNTDDVNAALAGRDVAVGLLFRCSAWQATVNSQLALVVERRMKEVLTRMGLPPDSVEITKN